MIIVPAAEAAACGWLGLIALVAASTWPRRPGPAPASLALRGEPPALVSLLAGDLQRDGYAATLLDLAARGWFRMEEIEPGRVLCRLPVPEPQDGPAVDERENLTAYERAAVAHLGFRAAGTGIVPGAALGSGFEPDENEFHTAFADEVRADASRRGLTRRRIGRGTHALLAAAGIPAAVLTAAALARHGAPVLLALAWPVFGYAVILRLPAALRRHTVLTRAGRAAAAEWLGFRMAVTGSRSRPTAGTALLAADGDRRIGYAAALGAAPAAVAAFAEDGDHLWSSYGGRWHRVTVGTTDEAYVPGVILLGAVTAVGVLPVTMTLILALQAGLLWAGLFALLPGSVWAGTLWILVRCAARARRLPPFAEFDGQILQRRTMIIKGDENSETTRYCVVIDDGEREQAWALSVAYQAYASSRPGILVHVQVDPRRNHLIAMSPAALPPAGA